MVRRSAAAALIALAHATSAGAQTTAVDTLASRSAPARPVTGVAAPAVVHPPAYTIGTDDVLTVVFWREKDLSGDVVVRPDGKISLPLLNDVEAAGLTTDQLRERLVVEARHFVEDPSATVVVKQINSRKVFITGNVEKPGPYPLMAPMTVVQLIAMAGGLKEFADQKHIVIMRMETNRPVSYLFDYKSILKRRNLKQNIELKPGDTVLVP